MVLEQQGAINAAPDPLETDTRSADSITNFSFFITVFRGCICVRESDRKAQQEGGNVALR